MRGVLRIAFCAVVALAMAAFVPPCIATADTFEAPKTLFWCLALALAGLCGLVPAPSSRRRGMDEWAAMALLCWMALRTFAAWALLDWAVLVGWLLPPFLYLAGVRLSRQPSAIVSRLPTILFLVGAAQAALMVLQRFGFDPLFAATTNAQSYLPGRMIGTVGYHNQAVDLLAVCAALWIWRLGRPCQGSMAIGGRSPRQNNGPAADCNRLPVAETGLRALPPIALLGLLSALAAYRAGFAGVLAGGGVLFFAESFRGNRGRLRGTAAAAALAASLCAICLAVPQMRERAAGALTHPFATPALRTRATMARAAWAMVRERPLFGHGSGAYAFQYMKRVADGMPSEIGHEELGGVVFAREPHNDFLHLWSEFGLVGLLLALGWLAAVWRGQPASGRFLMGYWLVASCFGFPWHDTAAGPLFGLALGLMGGDRSEIVGSQSQSAAGRRSSAADCPRLSATDKTNARLPIAIGHRLPAILFFVGLAGAVLCLFQLGADAGWWRAFPWQGRALARAGGLLALEGQFAEAEEVLEVSRRLERSPEQCNNLGFVKMKLGQPSAAEAIYREWADSGIDHAKALRSLAGAQEAQGKWLDAGRSLFTLYRLWPQDSRDEDLFRTASLLLRGGDYLSARHLARQFEDHSGTTPRWTAEWENLLGAADLRAGWIESARLHFKKALEMKPTLESARRNLALLPSPDNSKANGSDLE